MCLCNSCYQFLLKRQLGSRSVSVTQCVLLLLCTCLFGGCCHRSLVCRVSVLAAFHSHQRNTTHLFQSCLCRCWRHGSLSQLVLWWTATVQRSAVCFAHQPAAKCHNITTSVLQSFNNYIRHARSQTKFHGTAIAELPKLTTKL